jgi:hypothetical protein
MRNDRPDHGSSPAVWVDAPASDSTEVATDSVRRHRSAFAAGDEAGDPSAFVPTTDPLSAPAPVVSRFRRRRQWSGW